MLLLQNSQLTFNKKDNMKLITTGIIGSLLTLASMVSAESYGTAFKFTTIINDHVTNYSVKAARRVALPSMLDWVCATVPVAIDNGIYEGGFLCVNSGGDRITLTAQCYQTREDSENKVVKLTNALPEVPVVIFRVQCQTISSDDEDDTNTVIQG